MIEQKNVSIEGNDYMLTQFKASLGLKLMKQLTKLLGPAFIELQKASDTSDIKGKNADEAKAKREEQAMMNAALVLIDNMDKVEVEALVMTLVTQGATKGTMPINFDMEFAGKYDVLFSLVKEIVSFNFGNVFSKLGSGGMGM